ncbi:hypothetical protein CA237_10715 [Sphingomonas sp. ABOLH]|nr:hypothetical protein CA237_10715 [Sphingomonas sp. ABOLH]
MRLTDTEEEAMNQAVDSILNGAPFSTAQSVARVVKRLRLKAAEEDVLLLQVASSSRLPAYKAWTTVPALTFALETGGWSVCGSKPHTDTSAPDVVQ